MFFLAFENKYLDTGLSIQWSSLWLTYATNKAWFSDVLHCRMF